MNLVYSMFQTFQYYCVSPKKRGALLTCCHGGVDSQRELRCGLRPEDCVAHVDLTEATERSFDTSESLSIASYQTRFQHTAQLLALQAVGRLRVFSPAVLSQRCRSASVSVQSNSQNSLYEPEAFL